jgi:predicted Abi (CAAX) family protease
MVNPIRTAYSMARGRLWRALTTLPDAVGWRFAALAAVVTLAAMAVVGFSGGLYHFAAPNVAALPLRLVSVLFVPSLGEEAVFRGLLVPDRSETPHPFASIALATVIFTCWHLVETLFLHHAAPIFLRADFLACAAILGVGCAVIRWRTDSLWPAVALHWLAVVIWQTWLGGPDVEALK